MTGPGICVFVVDIVEVIASSDLSLNVKLCKVVQTTVMSSLTLESFLLSSAPLKHSHVLLPLHWLISFIHDQNMKQNRNKFWCVSDLPD